MERKKEKRKEGKGIGRCTVRLGYHDKILQTGWLEQQKCISSALWKLEV